MVGMGIQRIERLKQGFPVDQKDNGTRIGKRAEQFFELRLLVILAFALASERIGEAAAGQAESSRSREGLRADWQSRDCLQ